MRLEYNAFFYESELYYLDMLVIRGTFEKYVAWHNNSNKKSYKILKRDNDIVEWVYILIYKYYIPGRLGR